MADINTGDTAWMLVCSALVLFMTPGLALFYAGMVRRKNVLSTTMHSFFAMGFVSILWAVVGYTIAFGNADGAFGAYIGAFDKLGLTGVVQAVTGAEGALYPESVFAMYQGMFAIITVGLITGAIAERMKFSAYVIFAGVWVLLVYSPLAHWVWGGGFLGANGLGALDFAGGTVVHIASAAAALACALVLGRRTRLRHLGRAAAQPADDPARRRHPVVRLVRVQRGLGARRRRRHSLGVHGHPPRGSRRHSWAGSSPRSSSTASRPRSAPPRVPWLAWSRSRPQPATSTRCQR